MTKAKDGKVGGYWVTACWCGGKALYHSKGKGYCRDHRYQAIDNRIRFRDEIDNFSSEIEDDLPFDDLDFRILKAKAPSEKELK